RRARASAPITVGRASSHTSTTSTTAAVPSARPMSSASAGGAREEDHAVSVARDLGEVLDELRLPAPAGRAGRHGRPHAGVELAPERLDQLALLLGDVHEQERELIEAFRRELDSGMWAAVPTSSPGGRRQAELVKDFAEVPRDADRVIFFPRAAGGR